MKNIKFATLKTVVENSRELKVFDEGSGGRLSLKSNFVWTFVGNIVYAGCQWGILMILAKLGSPEMVGQFALGLAITAPIILFANLQIRAVQATDTRQEYSFADYLALRLFTTILALLVITGIILTLGNSLETTLTLFLIGLAKAFEAISDVFYGLLQQQERMDRIAISMIIKGLLSLAFLGLTLYFTRNLLYAVCVLAFVWALVLVVYDCRSGALTLSSLKPQASLNKWKWSSLRPRWNLKTLARLAWLSLPLGIAMSIISLNSNIPRYFIQHYFGEWELGIFAALTYLLMVGNTLVSALGQAATPRLAYYFASEDIKAFNSLLLKLVFLGTLIGGVGLGLSLLAGRLILGLIYRAEYSDYLDLFIWVMVAGMIGYVASFLNYSMTAARLFQVQIPLFGTLAIVTVLGCLVLIPYFGLSGAALVMSLASSFQIAGSTAILFYTLHKKKPEADPDKTAPGSTSVWSWRAKPRRD